MIKPKNLAQFCELYQDSLILKNGVKKANTIYGQFRTALTRGVIPHFGYCPPKGRIPTKAEKKAAWECLETIPIERLKDFPEIQLKVFEEYNVSSRSRSTYQCRLLQGMTWAEEQPWYSLQLIGEGNNHCPVRRLGHGSLKNCRVTKRVTKPPYYLHRSKRTPKLLKEMEGILRYYGDNYYPGRTFAPLAASTLKNYQDNLWRILGYFHSVVGIPADELSLELLVPKVKIKRVADPIAALRETEEAAETFDRWFCDYLNFLFNERQVESFGAAYNAALATYALARFYYFRETDDPQYKDIPVTRRIQQRVEEMRKKLEQTDGVADENKKWLPLPEVLQQIVSPLRLECGYRNNQGALRAIKTITSCFMRFLIFYLFTARPPRRQRIFRELRISLSCPVTRPEGIYPDQVIHPLPDNRMQHQKNGFLYKSAEGKWFIDLQSKSHKAGRTHKAQTLEIPNHTFGDGHGFYDFLEAYLYGYYRDEKGNWSSGGQIQETPTVRGQWFSLRMCFNPTHDFVFFKPQTGQPHDKSSFGDLVTKAAHRLSGKALNPHLLRDIYATWFLDQGATDAQIQSLAYAMGHSVATLRKNYDRRRSGDKTRPIEVEMLKLLDEYLD